MSILIEDIPITSFVTKEALFEQLFSFVSSPHQAIVAYLNVHVANEAARNPELKSYLQMADICYADGAGIVLASKILGTPLPCRLTAADWFIELMDFFAKKRLSVYLLAGAPGVAKSAEQIIEYALPLSPIIGAHHGYLHHDDLATQAVIDEISELQPDILIVGMGTPLQEQWIATHKAQLPVKLIYGVGAVLDFVTGQVSRCPGWMGALGLEWLYRLFMEPKRMWQRYIIGNPAFLGRIIRARFNQSFLRVAGNESKH